MPKCHSLTAEDHSSCRSMQTGPLRPKSRWVNNSAIRQKHPTKLNPPVIGWKVQHASSSPVEKDKLPHTHSASAPLRVLQGWCTSSRVFSSGAVKLTAALPAEWNDIVRSLSLLHSPALSLSLFLSLAPPPPLCALTGSTNCTAQQCSPTAAAAPAWALRIQVCRDF